MFGIIITAIYLLSGFMFWIISTGRTFIEYVVHVTNDCNEAFENWIDYCLTNKYLEVAFRVWPITYVLACVLWPITVTIIEIFRYKLKKNEKEEIYFEEEES